MKIMSSSGEIRCAWTSIEINKLKIQETRKIKEVRQCKKKGSHTRRKQNEKEANINPPAPRTYTTASKTGG